MRGNNEHERKKRCPFLDDWCIGENCALSMELRKQEGGVMKVAHVCALNATVQMLSEINAKTQGPQQQKKIHLPGLQGN